MNRFRCLVVFSALSASTLLLLSSSVMAQGIQLDFARQHIERAPAADKIDFAEPFIVEARVADISAFRDLLDGSSIATLSSDGQSLRFKSRAADVLLSKPEPRHLSSSFLIDFDDTQFQQRLSEFEGEFSSSPDVAELQLWVNNYISNKTGSVGYDYASGVMEDRAGDCTEHAVLLTALARYFKMPARVVHGALLLEQSGQLHLYGHAWTEVHDGTQWKIADATLDNGNYIEQRVRHFPYYEIDNEGPGFFLSILNWLNRTPFHFESLEQDQSCCH